MKKVTNAELEKLQTLNTEFSKTRLSIGDLELSKMDLVKKLMSIWFSRSLEHIFLWGVSAIARSNTSQLFAECAPACLCLILLRV